MSCKPYYKLQHPKGCKPESKETADDLYRNHDKTPGNFKYGCKRDFKKY